MNLSHEKTGRWIPVLAGVAILAGLFWISQIDYLLFHSLAELLCVVIACCVFLLAWNSRRMMDNNYLLFLGIAYLFVAGLDVFHTLAYKGMNVFSDRSSDLATQFWVAGRYLESGSLLVAPIFLRRTLRPVAAFLIYLGIFVLFLALILGWEAFPACFIEGRGLTTFKVVSEYAICLTLAASILHLHRYRKEFHPGVYRLILAAILLTIGAELLFTTYQDVYGVTNFAGHYLKILSFYLVYKAIIVTGLTRPYDLLFRNLKRQEEELRRSHAELVELNEVKNRFLAVAAHDLRGPISIIKGFLTVLDVPPDQEKIRDSIDSACRNMLGLIGELLDVHAIEAGQLDLKIREVNVGEFLKELHGSYLLVVKAKDMNLQLDLTEPLPRVPMDPERISQVIDNLVSNAVKFSYPGSTITLKAWVAGPDVHIAVADEGQGINKDELAGLFTDFGRTSTRPTAGERSTGLGLAIVKRLVTAHGGNIQVESTKGKGSVFTFRLPRASVVSTRATAPRKEGPVRANP